MLPNWGIVREGRELSCSLTIGENPSGHLVMSWGGADKGHACVWDRPRTEREKTPGSWAIISLEPEVTKSGV